MIPGSPHGVSAEARKTRPGREGRRIVRPTPILYDPHYGASIGFAADFGEGGSILRVRITQSCVLGEIRRRYERPELDRNPRRKTWGVACEEETIGGFGEDVGG